MKCACGTDAGVTQTIPRPNGDIWRYRKCPACADSFKTVESRVEKPGPAELKARAKLRNKRRWLRETARNEAAATGEPAQAIYERWGCA